MKLHSLWVCCVVLFVFFFSEEIAFYNGNVREKQTIHKTFRKLVRLLLSFKHFKQNFS